MSQKLYKFNAVENPIEVYVLILTHPQYLC
jgi:hypothetical protein